jgi:hypothetical protein
MSMFTESSNKELVIRSMLHGIPGDKFVWTGTESEYEDLKEKRDDTHYFVYD